MQARDDDDSLGLLEEVHAKRKPSEPRASNSLMEQWKALRLFNDIDEGRTHGIQEVHPKGWPPALTARRSRKSAIYYAPARW